MVFSPKYHPYKIQIIKGILNFGDISDIFFAKKNFEPLKTMQGMFKNHARNVPQKGFN